MNKISNGCIGKVFQPHINQNQPALAQPKNRKNRFIERINRLFNTGLFNKLLKHPKKTKRQKSHHPIRVS